MLYICFYNILLRQIYFYSCRKNATQSEINWLWEHKIMKPTTRQGRKPFSARCVSSLSANIYLVTFTHVFSCVNLCYYVKNTKSPKCTTVKVPRSSRIHSSLLDNNTGGNWAMCSGTRMWNALVFSNIWIYLEYDSGQLYCFFHICFWLSVIFLSFLFLLLPK